MNRDAASISPALVSLIRDAVMLLGLDALEAAKVAQRGTLVADGILILACDLPSAPGTVGHDMLLAATLGDVRVTEVDHGLLLLRSNMLAGPTAGLSFAIGGDGEVQLLHAARRQDMTPRTLAEKIHQMASLAKVALEQLLPEAPEDGAGAAERAGESVGAGSAR